MLLKQARCNIFRAPRLIDFLGNGWSSTTTIMSEARRSGLEARRSDSEAIRNLNCISLYFSRIDSDPKEISGRRRFSHSLLSAILLLIYSILYLTGWQRWPAELPWRRRDCCGWIDFMGYFRRRSLSAILSIRLHQNKFLPGLDQRKYSFQYYDTFHKHSLSTTKFTDVLEK